MSIENLVVKVIVDVLLYVNDFEIKCFIIDFNMIDEIIVDEQGCVFVCILLIVVGCFFKIELCEQVIEVVCSVDGVISVFVEFGIMIDEQCDVFKVQLCGDVFECVIFFV